MKEVYAILSSQRGVLGQNFLAWREAYAQLWIIYDVSIDLFNKNVHLQHDNFKLFLLQTCFDTHM